MNLKEAFQMQKALSRLMEEAASYLDDTDNIMTVTEKHLRSKVVPEQADESVDCSEKSRMAYNPMTVLRAWHALMEEKERLGRAITQAKATMTLNFDTAAEENKARRRFLHTLAHMAEQRSDSRMRRGAGKGYVFKRTATRRPTATTSRWSRRSTTIGMPSAVCRTHFPKQQPTPPAPSTRHLCAPKSTSPCSSRSRRAPSAKIPPNALSTSASVAMRAVPSQRSSSCWRGSRENKSAPFGSLRAPLPP